MKRIARVGVLVGIVAANAFAAAPVPDLSWLVGAWCGESDGTRYEELWIPSRGGLMLGVHRETRDGRAAGFEFLRIELRPGTATYLAQPGGKPATAFQLRSSNARSVSFANDRHDFPKRVMYERLDAARLRARVDDGKGGDALEWTWTRCKPYEGF
jgi:hypothetical protein